MRAELKEMFSTSLTTPLEEYRPEFIDNFGLLLHLQIGPEGVDASDSFDLLVCTPEWIRQEHGEVRYVWGHHMLIVLEYDLPFIKGLIERRVSRTTGKEWVEIAQKLSRFAAWEFEDYSSSRSV